MTAEAWDYARFKAAFYKKTGLDLDRYKDRQMERRIRQLMQRENKPDFALFFSYLVETPPAMERFMNYLTINTSEFFRDDKVYDKLQREVLPELLRNFSRTIKIWSAGCSIGAEPYTVAIILDQLGALARTEIIATDVDDKALTTAQQGCYNVKQLGKTPDFLVKRYFSVDNDRCWVKPQIQRAVVYKRHNLLTDPPVQDCHMILCRNVFIYFKTETQDFLLERFSRALKTDGYLIIGSAEYISSPSRFMLSKRHNTIYKKN